jgi:NADH-ubiquinone oxidoreductase chain 4
MVLLVIKNQSFYLKARRRLRGLVFLLILSPFLVKIPLIGVHYWLPKAHVEANTGGSIILAGLLLKLGRYGAYRVVSLLGRTLSAARSLVWIVLRGLRGLITIAQSDTKKLIAYSRVTHISFMMVAIMRNRKLLVFCVLLLSLAHGWASMGLFLRAGTLRMSAGSRLGKTLLLETNLHWFGLVVGIMLVINSSIPPTVSFFPEIGMLIILRSFRIYLTVSFLLLRLVVLYYNVYLFFLISNVKTSLPTPKLISQEPIVLLLIVLTSVLSLMWLKLCLNFLGRLLLYSVMFNPQ